MKRLGGGLDRDKANSSTHSPSYLMDVCCNLLWGKAPEIEEIMGNVVRMGKTVTESINDDDDDDDNDNNNDNNNNNNNVLIIE